MLRRGGGHFRILHFLAYLALFWPKIMAIPLNRIWWRIWALLIACRKPLYLDDFWGSYQLRLLILTDFCLVLWFKENPRKMTRGFLSYFRKVYIRILENGNRCSYACYISGKKSRQPQKVQLKFFIGAFAKRYCISSQILRYGLPEDFLSKWQKS